MTTLKELSMESLQMQGMRVYEIAAIERIGIGVIYNIDCTNKRAAVNILMEDWENRIPAREAVVLLLKIIFDEMNFEKAEFYYCANDRCRSRILNNLRITTDGRLRNHFLKDGKYQTITIMSILRHEYERFFHNEQRVAELIYDLPS